MNVMIRIQAHRKMKNAHKTAKNVHKFSFRRGVFFALSGFDGEIEFSSIGGEACLRARQQQRGKLRNEAFSALREFNNGAQKCERRGVYDVVGSKMEKLSR